MNKWINKTKLFFVCGLILTTLNCGFVPESECELTETDGQNILGTDVVSIDKSNSVFGDSAAKNKNLRACGYVSKDPAGDSGYLYWTQGKSEDAQEAKRLFDLSTQNFSGEDNFSVEKIEGIGEEANLSQYQNTDSKHLSLSVRKGESIFLITSSKPLKSEMPIEQIKLLAERIAQKTGN